MGLQYSGLKERDSPGNSAGELLQLVTKPGLLSPFFSGLVFFKAIIVIEPYLENTELQKKCPL